MFVADHLSRAFLKDTGPKDEEFQVFALELMYLMYLLPTTSCSTTAESSQSFPENGSLST